MSAAASTIVSRVRTQLMDQGVTGPYRWTDAELLQWISDGQRTIIAAAPRSSSLVAVMPMVAGTRQTIPAGGYALIAVNRNMGANSTTPGQALQHVDKEMMDIQYPFWHAAAPVAQPVAWMFDPSDEANFYVTPPSDGTGTLEVNYSQNGPEILTDATTLTVKDIYATPLFDYTMWRAHQKDSDYSGGQAEANTYLNAFEGFLKGLMSDPMTLVSQTGGGTAMPPAPSRGGPQ